MLDKRRLEIITNFLLTHKGELFKASKALTIGETARIKTLIQEALTILLRHAPSTVKIDAIQAIRALESE